MKRQISEEEKEDPQPSPSQSNKLSRLGKCEVCNFQDARYTCPKCEIKSCCIKCLNIHKTELNCDGIRDRTKFIPLKKMTKMDFMNDYYFLEECTRYADDRRTDKMKRYTRFHKTLPSHLFKLRNAARDRKTHIRFLLPNFTRNSCNTTYYDWSTKTIFWRVEWIFTNAEGRKFVDERCCENTKLYDLLDKYFNVDTSEPEVPMKKSLEVYQSRGVGNVRILLKAEGIKKSGQRFYELNCDQTLKENLAGKIIVEFPTIYLMYDALAEECDIIDSDEDVIGDSKQYEEKLNEQYKSEQEKIRKNSRKTEEELKKDAEDEVERKKQADRKKRRAERKAQPQNFFFTETNASDESSANGEDSDETEEEKT